MSRTAVSLTKEQLAALDPCDAERRLALFGRKKSMTAAQALAAGATVSDLLWVAGRLGMKDKCVRFALLCAQRTAHLNTDPRVQAALDATQAWLDAPSEETAAAADAAAAAAAAYAAAYAADAACAAYAAAYAADADAYAADADAAAAAYAAYAAEQEEQRRIFLEVFG